MRNRRFALLYIILSSLLFLADSSMGQQHFTGVGDFTAAMNIHPVEATINGVSLSAGDEIGIFDGDICVGAMELTSSLEELKDAEVIHGAARADDKTTSHTDGFIPGNTITFRVWDDSEGVEISNIESDFYSKTAELITPAPVYETRQTVFVSLKATYNTAPVAVAGTDSAVDENSLVELDGSGSFDNEGHSLSFIWTDIDNIGLSSLNEVKPSFTAPEVTGDSNYRLALTVSDGVLESEPDTVMVVVKNVPEPPIADAGADVNIEEDKRSQLDGSGSSDPEGLDLTYSWKIVPSDFVPGTPQSSITDFVAPEVSKDEQYLAVLTVTNNLGLSHADTAVITVINRVEPPVANAGADFAVEENTGSYKLDGSYSNDPQNRAITYSWKDIDNLGLTETGSAYPTFNSPTVEQDKDYRVILSVNNGVWTSGLDTVVITVIANSSPVIITKLNVQAEEGNELVLDAASSYDPDEDELVFQWSVFFESQKELVVFDDAASPTPTLKVQEVEEDKTVRIKLKVSDSQNSKTVLIELHIININKAPVAEAGSDFTIEERSAAILDGTESYDEDGNNCTYYWYSEELTINDATAATLEVTAPEVEKDKTVWVTLTVNDGTNESEPDTVRITIKNINRQPVAHAGKGGEVKEGEFFTLDGSDSSDPDGDELTYHWNLPELLKGNLQSTALIATAPQVERDTVLPVILTVSDGEKTSRPDTAFITVKQVNQSPQFAPMPLGVAHVGYQFSAEIQVTDPDVLDEVVIFSDDLPKWLELLDYGNRKALLSADRIPRDESLLGSHSFIIKATDGFQTVEYTVTLALSVQTASEVFNVGEVEIYPNPVSGILNVDFNFLPDNGTLIFLYNSEGRILFSQEAIRQNLQINLTKKPAGLYYLKINSAKHSHTKKIIIQNN